MEKKLSVSLVACAPGHKLGISLFVGVSVAVCEECCCLQRQSGHRERGWGCSGCAARCSRCRIRQVTICSHPCPAKSRQGGLRMQQARQTFVSPGQIINGIYSGRCLEMSLSAGAQSVAFHLSLPAVTCSSRACFLLPTELPNARASTSKSAAACWCVSGPF